MYNTTINFSLVSLANFSVNVDLGLTQSITQHLFSYMIGIVSDLFKHHQEKDKGYSVSSSLRLFMELSFSKVANNNLEKELNTQNQTSPRRSWNLW